MSSHRIINSTLIGKELDLVESDSKTTPVIIKNIMWFGSPWNCHISISYTLESGEESCVALSYPSNSKVDEQYCDKDGRYLNYQNKPLSIAGVYETQIIESK